MTLLLQDRDGGTPRRRHASVVWGVRSMERVKDGDTGVTRDGPGDP